ncbi:MAG: MgtC/SapB family protein [Chloroflexota bacterium]
MEENTLFLRFGTALLIGMLVGIQRQYAYIDHEDTDSQLPMVAGVRTFALLGLSGAGAAMISEHFDSPWPFVSLILALTAFFCTAYFLRAREDGDVGMTTEIAAIVVVMAGMLAYWDELTLAVALGVVTTGLLSFKLELHGLAASISREDILATLKFAAITAIILPVLPNETYGPPPFNVLNPQNIWWMVVLISGISFFGYILMKLVGSERGLSLTGILGGLASSTAATLSFAQRSQRSPGHLAKPFALAITLAWTVMFARILVQVAVVYAPLLRVLWLPMVVMGGTGLLYGLYLYLAPSGDDQEDIEISNPFDLGPAIMFGLLYGVVLLASNGAQQWFGDTGLYLSGLIAGMADLNAITLSMAELSRTGNVTMDVASRTIVLAAVSNTAVKGIIVLAAGTAVLRRAFLPGFFLILITGIGAAVLL